MTENVQWDIVSGVGVTALAVSLARAMETRRQDGLVDDPFAEHFVGAVDLPEPFASAWPGVDEGAAAEPASWWDSMPTYMGVRSRYFDDFFAEANRAGIRQVVLLAAGLDTRAYRLDWADGTEVFELDQSLVLKFKDEVLDSLDAQPRCARRTVATDLRDDWAAELRGSGFDQERPTAWLAEGLLSFLPAETEASLFAGITELSAPGSRFAVEAVGGGVRHMALTTPPARAWEEHVRVDVTKLWNPELRPEPIDVLREDGWTLDIRPLADAASRYGRPVRGVMTIPAQFSLLVSATR